MRPLLLCLAVQILQADEPNLIDRHLFGKIQRDRIPVAAQSSDSEFIRRVFLDLTGRIPDPATTRTFLAGTDPHKRAKLIEALFPTLPVSGMRSIGQAPFLDRWTYFFDDLFRNGQLLKDGINTFHEHLYKSLTLNIPYDEFVRDLITASAVSTWAEGAANFVARSHVFEGDGYQMNHEDTADEIAINTTRLFLGVNLECISCHDGVRHLEKVNLWLTGRKREEMWRQASFFGKTFIDPAYGRFPQFLVKDTRAGYDLSTRSSLRPPRNRKADVSPTFLLSGGKPLPGENLRQSYARILTTHPQFARAAVNLFWAELMGQGIVDTPFDFDLARQDPKNPPPLPWSLQPSHPELLEELAEDFRTHNHDLRRLFRLIVSSRAYQLSSLAPANWKSTYDSYFARHITRRLSAEQTFDAVANSAGFTQSYKVTYADKRAASVMQTHSPQDIEKSDSPAFTALQAFGQCDRYAIEASRKPTMVQSAILMNDRVVRERIKVAKGNRLDTLLHADPARSNSDIVDELYLAALSRFPSASERGMGIDALREFREQGAEDLLWVLINRLDFLFY